MSTKNEVKSNKINEELRSELSLALNKWQDIENKTDSKSENGTKSNEYTKNQKPKKKTKLLKVIQAQLESLSL